MRGDHETVVLALLEAVGPTPHARGPRRPGRTASPGSGTNPACAGTTGPGCCSGPGARDQPRMRGDHEILSALGIDTRGPTPHARGPRVNTLIPDSLMGTNPACAGTTGEPGTPRRASRDQPRMRGDHTPAVSFRLGEAGPTPHARGPQQRPAGHRVRPGTNPACAGTTSTPCVPRPRSRDQPRMRGDHRHPWIFPFLMEGPTPHARGPLIAGAAIVTVLGTNPACAGTTSGSAACRSRKWDQPRMRGDHGSDGSSANSPRISSTYHHSRDQPRMRGDHHERVAQKLLSQGPTPHARGPPPRRASPCSTCGTNPACAGTTQPGGLASRPPGDQPRMRGDHASRQLASVAQWGPTPHARGPPSPTVTRGRNDGTNPACAGTTALPRHRAGVDRDQPRMRGDHDRAWSERPRCAGPTPHARGPRLQDMLQAQTAGTNPACAGTTCSAPRRPTAARDQPRMRGDHTSPGSASASAEGPTPHARGPHSPHHPTPGGLGTNPACAGTTPRSGRRAGATGDQPRMRGDHPTIKRRRVGGQGPTPHARGPHQDAAGFGGTTGTNPACAGTTPRTGTRPRSAGDQPRMRGDHPSG